MRPILAIITLIGAASAFAPASLTKVRLSWLNAKLCRSTEGEELGIRDVEYFAFEFNYDLVLCQWNLNWRNLKCILMRRVVTHYLMLHIPRPILTSSLTIVSLFSHVPPTLTPISTKSNNLSNIGKPSIKRKSRRPPRLYQTRRPIRPIQPRHRRIWRNPCMVSSRRTQALPRRYARRHRLPSPRRRNPFPRHALIEHFLWIPLHDEALWILGACTRWGQGTDSGHLLFNRVGDGEQWAALYEGWGYADDCLSRDRLFKCWGSQVEEEEG